MIDLAGLTQLLGWASLLNIAYLILATAALKFSGNSVYSIHSYLFGLDKKELASKYFDFLSNYKVATLVFLVAPYFALKIMGY